MSIRVMNRVWEHAEYKESTLLILLALADFADDNGICWPEVPTLAAKARVSDRRAIDIIQALEKDGAIIYQRGGGRGRRSLYGVLVGLTDEQKERVKEFHRNYFTENKTVKSGAQKGELQRKERVNYSVNSSKGLEQQEASNPDPIRQEIRQGDPSVGNRPKKQDETPAPAIDLYTQLTGRKPIKFAADRIAKEVSDLSRWRNTVNDWLASGYKPNNVVGMLDWYHGKGRHQNNNAPANRQPADLPTITAADSTKRIATPEDRRRIIEAKRAELTGK